MNEEKLNIKKPIENWSIDKENYILSEKYLITKADPKEFAVYESVYGDKTYNRFAVKHWDLRLAISGDNPFAKEDSFYWIKDGEVRIGGVLIEPNVISRLFIIPPFSNLFEIVKLLKKLLVKWSDSSKDICAYQILPEQAPYFQMVGFWTDKNRRWMMRPTEILDFNWNNNVVIKVPEKSNNTEIVGLFYECFKNGIDSHYIAKQSGQECGYEDYLAEVNEYFEICTEDILLESSSLIYDKANGKLIGACLISNCEEWPLVYDIAVHPDYRGNDYAKTMLKKALTILNSKYSILRLFVTLGNVAESVYYELGFVQGVEFNKLYIPKK